MSKPITTAVNADPVIAAALAKHGSIYALARAIPCAYTTAFQWVHGMRKPSPYYRRRLEELAKQ